MIDISIQKNIIIPLSIEEKFTWYTISANSAERMYRTP